MKRLAVARIVTACRTSLLTLICFGPGLLRLEPLPAQDRASSHETPPALTAAVGVPRAAFLATESLDEATKKLSEALLQKALESEAFYTLVGQLKPVSEGFWGGYFALDPAELREIEQVRAALRCWHVPDLFFADVLVYESVQYDQRYASAYVVHIPSLKKLIERESAFFARWGITARTPPAEVMLTIERSRQPDDRWRGFGLVF